VGIATGQSPATGRIGAKRLLRPLQSHQAQRDARRWSLNLVCGGRCDILDSIKVLAVSADTPNIILVGRSKRLDSFEVITHPRDRRGALMHAFGGHIFR
jgi:hypothetical protein